MRPTVLNPLSYEEHRELSREIQNSRMKLRQLASVVQGVYGQQNRTAFTFQKVTEAMDRLCSEMQVQADVDCPGLNASDFYK
jgi:hypothetical protein